MTVAGRLERGQLIRLSVRLRRRMACWRQMVLDTGARITVVHPDVAREIGLDLSEVSEVELVGVAGSAVVPKATIDAVSVLGQTVRNLDVICHPLHPRLGFDGILGMNFLQHFNILIDNDSETITFERCQG